jgi:Carboxypeptidase regulatory-like domain
VRQNRQKSGGPGYFAKRVRRYGWTGVGVALITGLLGLAGLSQVHAEPQPQSAGMGALAGSVTRWPGSPVGGPGISGPEAPAAGVKLVVYGPASQAIASVLTDERGHFRVTLPPGAYRIEMAPAQGREFTKDLPATVIITQGQETRLDLRLDSGVR